MKVHINELKKGRKRGFKVRWHEDGKPKEAFRKEFKDALALQAQIRERLFGDSKEQYHKTYLTESQLNDAEAALLELNGRLSLREAARLALKHWIDAADGIPIEEAEAEEIRIARSKLGGGKISNSAEELKKEIQMLKDGRAEEQLTSYSQ